MFDVAANKLYSFFYKALMCWNIVPFFLLPFRKEMKERRV